MGRPEAGHLQEEAERHYASGDEQHRFSSPGGQLEFARTQELLQRYLPPPPAVILDIGGGPGAYALWLAGLGYVVYLIDILPLHVEQALRASEASSQARLAGAVVGDARQLDVPDGTADAVLLLGPLYHLVEQSDRLAALGEAHRVLRGGGLIFAAAISRFASALDGLVRGYFHDEQFVRIVEQDLKDGQHRNPTEHPAYFTTAFFHHPDELTAEVEEAGFRLEQLLGVEGPGRWMPNLAGFWEDESQRERLLAVIRALESELSIIGMSAHLMAVGRKPS